MKQIRLNTFETNSSSVHALCIANDTRTILPDFSPLAEFGEYGRCDDNLSGLYYKLSYLYTMINYLNQQKAQDYHRCIERAFEESGVPCRFEHSDDHGYIDHGNEWEDVQELDEFFHNNDKLARFLFGEDSFILLGDDDQDRYFNVIREIRKSGDYEVIER